MLHLVRRFFSSLVPRGPSRADDQGLLDAALDDARDLRRKLGKGDQQKLEEYLDAVRGVERRLGYSRPKGNGWRPPTQPERLTPPPAMARFSGVRRHAPLETVEQAVTAAAGADGLVALGGGSAIDTAKAVSAAK